MKRSAFYLHKSISLSLLSRKTNARQNYGQLRREEEVLRFAIRCIISRSTQSISPHTHTLCAFQVLIDVQSFCQQHSAWIGSDFEYSQHARGQARFANGKTMATTTTKALAINVRQLFEQTMAQINKRVDPGSISKDKSVWVGFGH